MPDYIIFFIFNMLRIFEARLDRRELLGSSTIVKFIDSLSEQRIPQSFTFATIISLYYKVLESHTCKKQESSSASKVSTSFTDTV